MPGQVVPMPNSRGVTIERVKITPTIALEMIEADESVGENRPLRQAKVNEIANEILNGKWQFNGETIKFSRQRPKRVLDGQHRLWAVVEAGKPIDTVVVRGLDESTFVTIDTIRSMRTPGDIIALMGQRGGRNQIATALKWLRHWQNGTMLEYRSYANIIHNSDIEELFKAHPNMVKAVERAQKLRSLANPSLLAFLYYITANRNPDLAEKFVGVLEEPAGVGVTNPIYKYREWLLSDPDRRKDPLTILAIGIKSLNLAAKNRSAKTRLQWRTQGSRPEAFPELEV